MATKKETIKVKGIDLTIHEKKVYDFVSENGKVDYNLVAEKCEISPRSAVATLARLEKTHGLLKKNEPTKVTTYEVM